jgi:hypothetical protein
MHEIDTDALREAFVSEGAIVGVVAERKVMGAAG